MKILHAVAALAFAHLLELFAGNFHAVIPFSVCVLNRITAGFSLIWVFVCGFFSGLIFDLVYWHDFPAAASAMALSVTLVRFFSDRAGFKSRLAEAMFKGALSGGFVLFLTGVMLSASTGRFLPGGGQFIISVGAAAVFQVLISVPKSKVSEGIERGGAKENETAAKKDRPRTGRRNSAGGIKKQDKKR